jgi:phosphopantothenoylcysteine decarboxylase/phosphopantothenate--cysteine ligase
MHARNLLRKLRFLITAGGTREYIDPVRFISNASSGKMGYELARAAVCEGHRVTLITAPTNLPAPEGVAVVRVETASEMFQAVKERLRGCDCLIMAAAVSDYTPVRRAKNKIRRKAKSLTLKLKQTVDILGWAGRHKRRGQIVVGFALDDKNIRVNAERKLREKNLDMVVANTPAAIGADRSSVWIKTTFGDGLAVRNKKKAAIAGKIVQLAETFIQPSKNKCRQE